MFEIRLTGFKTKAQAEEFINWYGGQGEQDACYWLENACEDGKIDVNFMPTNGPATWDGNVLSQQLDMFEPEEE